MATHHLINSISTLFSKPFADFNRSSDSPYFAAVDLGSNSFHMLIVKVTDDSIVIVDRVKEMVQIARGLQHHKALSDDAKARALHCLSIFQERIRDIPSHQIRVVGTKALRMASDANSFLREAEAALNHPIEIISGYEEARLVYLGASQDISPDKGKPLIIDIGGGSTEFVIGEGTEAKLLESLSIGCVTFSDRFLTDKNGEAIDNITPAILNEIYYATSIELELILRRYRHEGWDIAVGSSGTMRAIAELMPSDVVSGVITREGLAGLKRCLIEDTPIDNITNISERRRSVLPAGILILSAIIDLLELDEIIVVDATLKEGLIYDTIGRLSAADMRDTTVEKLMDTYSIDRSQAERVDIALHHFLPALAQEPVLNGVNVKQLMHWAALLHEIGLTISHSGYHHHGYYLLSESDIAGFSRFEQELLALYVGCHRRKINTTRSSLLTAEDATAVATLLVFLRIAVLLNHRRENDIELPSLTINDHNIHLTFKDDWLDEHPLTYRNLLKEQRYLDAINVQLTFS